MPPIATMPAAAIIAAACRQCALPIPPLQKLSYLAYFVILSVRVLDQTIFLLDGGQIRPTRTV